MTKDEALKMALEHFETWNHEDSIFDGEFDKEITAIKEALAQPEQEPVAYASSVDWRKNHLMSKAQYDNCLPKNRVDFDVPLYTSPPASKPWVGLMEEEVDECYYWKDRLWTTDELVRHVEAKLKEKNT